MSLLRWLRQASAPLPLLDGPTGKRGDYILGGIIKKIRHLHIKLLGQCRFVPGLKSQSCQTTQVMREKQAVLEFCMIQTHLTRPA